MSSLGNLTNIRTIAFEHDIRGIYNYKMGKDNINNGNMLDAQSRKRVKDNIEQIWLAVSNLNDLKRDLVDQEPIELAIFNLKTKITKLEKKMANAQRNAEFLPKLESYLKKTNFDEIEKKEAAEIVSQVLNMSEIKYSSKITSMSIQILSKLSRFAPRNENNNNTPIVIGNPKEEIIDNNNNMVMPLQQQPVTLMDDINNALDLVSKGTPDEFGKRLHRFATQIEQIGKRLADVGFINFEHALHGQIYNYYTGKGFETKDVEGVPFARNAMQTGFITQDALTQCCNNTKTLMYLDTLRKLIEDTKISEEELNKYTNKIMVELEQHHAQTAWIVFGETSNFGTAGEKNLVEGDFGRNGFISDKVSRETKLKAVLKTIELRTAQIKKEYEQQ